MLFNTIATVCALAISANALAIPPPALSHDAFLADINFVQNVINFEICIISIDARRAAAALGNPYGDIPTCVVPVNPNIIINLNTQTTTTVIPPATSTTNFVTTVGNGPITSVTNSQTSTTTTTAPGDTQTTTTTESSISTATATATTTTTTSTVSTTTAQPAVTLVPGYLKITEVPNPMRKKRAAGDVNYAGNKNIPPPSDTIDYTINPPDSVDQPAAGGSSIISEAQFMADPSQALIVYAPTFNGKCGTITSTIFEFYAPMPGNAGTKFQYLGFGSNSADRGEVVSYTNSNEGFLGAVASSPYGPPFQGGYNSYGNNFYSESAVWSLNCFTQAVKTNYQAGNPPQAPGTGGPMELVLHLYSGTTNTNDNTIYTTLYTQFTDTHTRDVVFSFVPLDPAFYQ